MSIYFGTFEVLMHCLCLLLAIKNKENSVVYTKKHKEMMKCKKEASRIKEVEEHSLATESSTITSSPDDSKPQTPKEEENPPKDEQEVAAEEKSVDEKMEVDSSLNPSASAGTGGKCFK